MQYLKCGAEKFEFEIKPLGKLCKLCKSEVPVVTLTTQNLKLCKNCFSKIQQRRLSEAVKKYRMFGPEDRVGILLSGGKDSATLAHLLKKTFPEISFQGLYLNLGIRYYSDFAQKAVEELCESLSIPLFVYDLKAEKGFSIDDFVFTSFKDKICSVCGTIKRYLFSRVARELGLTVIATGHHLDDLLSTYLTLFFNEDFISIKRLVPVNLPLFEGQAKKIKPLYQIPEREIFFYAVLNELPLEGCACPHGEITPSKKIKGILEELEKENRTFKYQLLSVFLKGFIPLLRENFEESTLVPCKVCGEPTASVHGICGFCRRVNLLSRIEDKTLELSLAEWQKIEESSERQKWMVFDVREKEDYLKGTLPSAKWISPSLLENEKDLFKTFRPFREKNLLFFCYSGRLSYLFTLKLRKMNFRAYNLKEPEQILGIDQVPENG